MIAIRSWVPVPTATGGKEGKKFDRRNIPGAGLRSEAGIRAWDGIPSANAVSSLQSGKRASPPALDTSKQASSAVEDMHGHTSPWHRKQEKVSVSRRGRRTRGPGQKRGMFPALPAFVTS